MAKPLVENRICEACGADVRTGSLFCYNCGKSVAPNFIDATTNKIQKPDAFDLDGIDSSLSKTKDTAPLQDQTAEEPPAKTDEREEGKLKSAAQLRRKAKALPPKKIEVVWEEPESVPNGWFIAVSVILSLFVLLIFLLAMYFG